MAHPASGRHLPLIFGVWATSFHNPVGTPAQRRALIRDIFRFAKEGSLWVSRGGLTYALVIRQPTADEWYLDGIASFPRGRGHGSAILTAVLAAADHAEAPMFLHCPEPLVPWYERFGFLTTSAGTTQQDLLAQAGGLVRMTRAPQPIPTNGR